MQIGESCDCQRLFVCPHDILNYVNGPRTIRNPCVLRNNAFQVNIIKHYHKVYERLNVVGVGTSDVCRHNQPCMCL